MPQRWSYAMIPWGMADRTGCEPTGECGMRTNR